MGVILDTSLLIAWERKREDLERFQNSHTTEPLGLSVISGAELLHGVHRANSQARRIRRSTFVEHVLSLFPLFDFDLSAARVYAELWASLEDKGTKVSAHDLMIGSSALSLGFSVATFNVRDYQKIPGLQLFEV
jgi:predicted nucleic acid-binding protein